MPRASADTVMATELNMFSAWFLVIFCSIIKGVWQNPVNSPNIMSNIVDLYVYCLQFFLYKYYSHSLQNIISGFLNLNEIVHNRYTKLTEHVHTHTHFIRSFHRAMVLICTIVKITKYFINLLNYIWPDEKHKRKLKGHILKNGISHFHITW